MNNSRWGSWVKKNRTRLFWTITCIAFLFILLLTSNIELISDDWHFKFIFKSYMPGPGEKRISGLDDIIVSMKNYYMLSGGRILAHSILQAILMLDKSFFNFVNSLIFALVGMLIWNLAGRKEEKTIFCYVLIFVSMFIFLPSFGDTCLWVSGAINYLWMSAIYLTFFIFEKRGNCFAMCLFAFLAGFTNEPVGGMIIIFMITRWIVSHRRPKKNEVICCLLVLIGMIFILVAPGNRQRADIVNHTEIFSIRMAIYCFKNTVIWIFADFEFIPIAVSIVIMVIFRKNIKKFCDEIAFLTASFAGMGALTMSGAFFERAQFPCVVFLLVCFIGTVSKGYLMYKSSEKDDKLHLFFKKELVVFSCKITRIAIVGLVIVELVINLILFFRISSVETRQMNSVRIAAEKGESVQIDLMTYADTGTLFPQEVSVSNEYEALWQAEYYGINIEW